MAFLITSISGFLAFFLVLITLMLPYILRRQARAACGQAAAVWQRMKIHSWIGYTILALVTLHMYVSMGSGMLRYTSVSGINLATVGLLLIFAQVALGMSLERARGNRRPSLRRLHFVLMLGIVVLILAHVVMNSALLHALERYWGQSEYLRSNPSNPSIAHSKAIHRYESTELRRPGAAIQTASAGRGGGGIPRAAAGGEGKRGAGTADRALAV